MGHFATIEDIKQANADAGKFYFSPDSMRFFKSRVDTYVYGGRYFVTSERGPSADDRRLYSVRQAHADGDITTVGGFQNFKTLQGARNAAKRLAQAVLNAELQAELIAETAAHRRAEQHANEDAAIWAAWNALPEGPPTRRPVKTIAAALGLTADRVAAVVYPAATFGEWHDSQEPDVQYQD